MVNEFSIKKDLSILNARWLIDTISGDNPLNYMYTFIGRIIKWPNDNEVPYPADSDADLIEEWKNILALKRVQTADVSLGIHGIVWVNNTAYDMYDNADPNLLEKNYYVFTSDYRVYKCLDNNGGAKSTQEPNSTSITPFTTSDGYKWQLMYALSDSEVSKWYNSVVLPIKSVSTDDSSLQWQVQSAAVPGTIDSIQVVDGGSEYISGQDVTITITGDGTGATASAVLENGSIKRIIINTRGQNYTYANVSVSGNASLRAIISPLNGHGSNAIEELNARYLIIRSVFEKDENGTFPVNVPFRQIGVIINPTLYGTTDKATDSAGIDQTTSITLATEPTTFVAGEVIQNQTNNSNAVFVSHEGNVAKISDINGKFEVNDSIIGLSSGSTNTVTEVSNPHLNIYSGNILYVENHEPIMRLPTQTETYKLVIAF